MLSAIAWLSLSPPASTVTLISIGLCEDDLCTLPVLKPLKKSFIREFAYWRLAGGVYVVYGGLVI